MCIDLLMTHGVEVSDSVATYGARVQTMSGSCSLYCHCGVHHNTQFCRAATALSFYGTDCTHLPSMLVTDQDVSVFFADATASFLLTQTAYATMGKLCGPAVRRVLRQ